MYARQVIWIWIVDTTWNNPFLSNNFQLLLVELISLHLFKVTTNDLIFFVVIFQAKHGPWWNVIYSFGYFKRAQQEQFWNQYIYFLFTFYVQYWMAGVTCILFQNSDYHISLRFLALRVANFIFSCTSNGDTRIQKILCTISPKTFFPSAFVKIWQ